MFDYSEEEIKGLQNVAGRTYVEERTARTLADFLERYKDDQKAQAKDTKKAYNVSLIAIGLNALAIVVAVLIAFLS